MSYRALDELALPVSYVQPARRWNGFDWREMWERRELVVALVGRELQLRYRQTLAGFLWVLGQPLLTTLVMSLLLTRFAGQVRAGVPYPLFVYVALMAWAFLSHGLTRASVCFLENAPLVQRVYLPRLILPLATVTAALVDFGLALAFLPVLLLWYQVIPSWTILALPVVILFMFVAVFGFSLWVATMNAIYRDIAYALPFFLQLGLFVSPIFYSTEIVPLPWRWLYALNPMVGIVEGLRWTLLDPNTPPPLGTMLISAFATAVILLAGLYMFQHREPNLADVI